MDESKESGGILDTIKNTVEDTKDKIVGATDELATDIGSTASKIPGLDKMKELGENMVNKVKENIPTETPAMPVILGEMDSFRKTTIKVALVIFMAIIVMVFVFLHNASNDFSFFIHKEACPEGWNLNEGVCVYSQDTTKNFDVIKKDIDIAKKINENSGMSWPGYTDNEDWKAKYMNVLM